MAFKEKWKTDYEATAKRFGLNIDDYKTEEEFELALRVAVDKAKENKFALSEDKLPYIEQAVEMAKKLQPSVTDTRGWPREELKAFMVNIIHKNEEFLQFCLEHNLDADRIKAIAAELKND